MVSKKGKVVNKAVIIDKEPTNDVEDPPTVDINHQSAPKELMDAIIIRLLTKSHCVDNREITRSLYNILIPFLQEKRDHITEYILTNYSDELPLIVSEFKKTTTAKDVLYSIFEKTSDERKFWNLYYHLVDLHNVVNSMKNIEDIVTDAPEYVDNPLGL